MSDKPLEKLLEEKELAERLQVCPARARQGAVAPSEHWRRSGRRCRARRDDPADGSWLPAGKGVTPARESTTACPWPWSQQADRHRVGGFDCSSASRSTTIATPKPVFENDAAEIGMPPQHGRGPRPLIAETLRRRREELAKQPKDLSCAAGGAGTATDIGK